MAVVAQSGPLHWGSPLLSPPGLSLLSGLLPLLPHWTNRLCCCHFSCCHWLLHLILHPHLPQDHLGSLLLCCKSTPLPLTFSSSMFGFSPDIGIFPLQKGPFNLGWFSVPCGWLSSLWIIAMTVILTLPACMAANSFLQFS